MDKKEYRNRLMNIMQDDVFCELMNFWKIVEEAKYDFKIFVSKKCYVLYKICIPLFELYDIVSYKNCIKITDTAIPIYKRKMRGKTILIVDDVFIHGRTSLLIRNEISQKAKKINFYVFAKNEKTGINQDISNKKKNEHIKELIKRQNGNLIRYNNFEYHDIKEPSYIEQLKVCEFMLQKEEVKGHIKCNKEFQWKRISDVVMKSIWGINMPYVSYLPIITFKESISLNKTEMLLKGKEIYNHRQDELKQKFVYYINSNEEINSNAIIHYCFIVSQNDYMGTCKMVPMVFFDCENTSIDKKFILDSLKIIYGDNLDILLDYFSYSDKNSEGLIVLLKFLIFNVGYLSTKAILEENNIKCDEYHIDFENVRYSFGKEIEYYLEILKNVSVKKCLQKIESGTIRNNKCENVKVNQEQRKKLLIGLKEAYLSMEKCTMEEECLPIIDVLAKYFKYNNMYDEESIYKAETQNYVRGLKFSEFKEFFRRRKFSIDDIISGLMYQYNLGAATIDYLYDYNSRGDVIGVNMYWRSGEQSYKCISNTYVLPVYFQNLYRRRFCAEIATFLYDVFVDITGQNYKLWRVPFEKDDYEKYCGIKDDVYNSFDIEKYCEQDKFKYLGYLGKQMEQYVLFGNVTEIENKDKNSFKKKLLEFISKKTDDKTQEMCKLILEDERNA